ncbi:uncharacterized protein LOC131858204 [Cryptomeria japonica]|uniref:uncharacterized protein LOC131858204 n=1 Tax=Cryptomeria japonica TaxID=3369 RepID=UPI0027DA1E8A|nr:uncharacterized protein LOC131858204 [Cryptomeria japonica]
MGDTAMHEGLMVLIYEHLKANQIARMQPSAEIEEEGSDFAFSLEEESDSDPSSDSEESMDVSDYETRKKRKHNKTRPSSFKGKNPKGKIPEISLSSEEEVSEDSEEENPQGLLKKKTKVNTQTINKHKRKEENVKELEVYKKERTLEAELNSEKVTIDKVLRVATTFWDTTKKEQDIPDKADPPPPNPPPEGFDGCNPCPVLKRPFWHRHGGCLQRLQHLALYRPIAFTA